MRSWNVSRYEFSHVRNMGTEKSHEKISVRIFLTSALAGGEWSASRPGCFTPGESAYGTHWIGGWVDPRDGLDDVEKRKFLTVPGLEL
jgi:hypothetical protein